MFGPFLLEGTSEDDYSCNLHLKTDSGEQFIVRQVKSKFQDARKKTAEAKKNLIGQQVCFDTVKPDRFAVGGLKYWFNVWKYIESSPLIHKPEVLKVFGPPGTGKTYTVISYIENYLARDGSPNRVGFFTFTNVAAKVARDRVNAKFPQYPEDAFLYFSTLHKLATRIGALMGCNIFDHEKLKEFDSEITYEDVWLIKNDSGSVTVRPDHAVINAISLARNRLVEFDPKVLVNNDDLPRSIKNEDPSICIKNIEAFKFRYEQYKLKNNLADFDDVIENASTILEDSRIPGFDLLIIDEAQDLSKLQWKFVQRLMSKSRQVILAGDDDQAIMESFGASPETFLNINGSIEPLNNSNRVPQAVFEYVNRGVVKFLELQFPNRQKKIWNPTSKIGAVDPEFEYTELVDGSKVSKKSRIRRLYELVNCISNYQNEDWLILAPTKASCKVASDALRTSGVPHFRQNRPVLNAAQSCNIRVQTIHTSKGDEANNVAILSLSQADIEMLAEDPRLRYVAETRAKMNLYPKILK